MQFAKSVIETTILRLMEASADGSMLGPGREQVSVILKTMSRKGIHSGSHNGRQSACKRAV